MQKRAMTRYPVHDLIAERWSPRAFEDRAVEPQKLGSLLEAARWAPSCFNEQPWRFFVAARGELERFERLASCLTEGNSWAKAAPVLMLSIAKRTFALDGRPNRFGEHDVGLAAENLVLQATALGLSVHQMAGYDANRAREVLGIPDDFQSMAMIAVGYRGDAAKLPERLREREQAERKRKPLDEIIFGAAWGEPHELAAEPR